MPVNVAKQMHAMMQDAEMKRSAELADLRGTVKLLLTARIKDGSVTTDMVQAAELSEETKSEFTAKIAEVEAAAAEVVKA